MKQRKFILLLASGGAMLQLFGCFGDIPLNWIADVLTIVDHFEGQIPGF